MLSKMETSPSVTRRLWVNYALGLAPKSPSAHSTPLYLPHSVLPVLPEPAERLLWPGRASPSASQLLAFSPGKEQAAGVERQEEMPLWEGGMDKIRSHAGAWKAGAFWSLLLPSLCLHCVSCDPIPGGISLRSTRRPSEILGSQE